MLLRNSIFRDEDLPTGYEYLNSEPSFDPNVDLALEEPASVESLIDFGYDEKFISQYPSPFAISSPLRILSPSGVRKARTVLADLRKYTIWADSLGSPGIIRGSVYRSRFIRDLSLDASVAEFLSRVAGASVVPSAFGHQLAHINVPARTGTGLVGNWHIDQNSVVLVMSLHDSAGLEGGRFQYFKGHRADALSELRTGGEMPEERVASVDIPGPGYGLLMQGSAVAHRAEPLREPAERVTVVTSYEPVDVRFPDQNPQWIVSTGYNNNPNGAAEEMAREVELARHKAWRSQGLLDDFINDVAWDTPGDELVRKLAACVRDVVQACSAIQQGAVEAKAAVSHFEKLDTGKGSS